MLDFDAFVKLLVAVDLETTAVPRTAVEAGFFGFVEVKKLRKQFRGGGGPKAGFLRSADADEAGRSQLLVELEFVNFGVTSESLVSGGGGGGLGGQQDACE